MDEHILKRLTSRELKRTILQKAKDILEERERNPSERGKGNTATEKAATENATTSNEPCCNKNPGGAVVGGSDVVGDAPPDKQDISFHSLQDFSCKYLKMCQVNMLNHANVEYELVISFMRTFNSGYACLPMHKHVRNARVCVSHGGSSSACTLTLKPHTQHTHDDTCAELKFQLNLTSADDQGDEKNSVLHQMANLFADKLICYCTTPMAVVAPHGDSEGGLLGDELLEQIRFFFKQIEEKSHDNLLFNMCLGKIAECIFKFKPKGNPP
ncbi:hypothetical protein PVNG_04856 [Plasmodium vivax North Korean]|uniref:Uncharacterized protein n=1 Tax=Plasmodium vivax North Korean TaxID=1035514 RepID=A0A0J9TSG2_PLAVI|nr:hypothetical protein PVNG_04856 [Plasmodium vivax North Korean]